jgi:hypothetical protein
LLTRRADAEIRLGDYFEARSSTEAAWKALEPWSSTEDAAGVQFTTARLWHIDAKLRSAEQQPWPNIRRAWEASVAFHRKVIDLWREDGWVYFRSLAATLDGFAEAAERADETENVAQMREESERLKTARGQRR